MIKRVPRSRERGRSVLPKAIDATVERIRNHIAARAAQGDVEPDRIQKWLNNLATVEAKFRLAPPDSVCDVIRLPWPSPAIVETVCKMQWRILSAEPPEMFITSDNPAFIDEGNGIGKPDSELCFPLSPTRCLHCSHDRVRGGDLAFMSFHRETVREMNRRIASAATSIVMADRKESWPTKLLQRTPDLHRIVWTN